MDANTGEKCAEGGGTVIAGGRNPADAEALLALGSRYPAIELHALDVTDYAQMSSLSAQLRDRSIDILLSNAGIYGPRGANFGDVDAAAWREVFEVNSIAPMMLVQAFVEQVATSPQKLVAVISSTMGSIADNGSGGSYIYRSSKTAVNQVVRNLSIDLAGRGISVLSLHPGWVKTEMGGANAETSVGDSAGGLKAILQKAGPEQNGQFLEFNGDPIAW